MKYVAQSIVPTAYQLNSISTLMGGWEKLGNGSLMFRGPFKTKEDTRAWMRQRNDYLYQTGALSESKWKENKRTIRNVWPQIEYDSAVCKLYPR
jgi:hypothetical protein